MMSNSDVQYHRLWLYWHFSFWYQAKVPTTWLLGNGPERPNQVVGTLGGSSLKQDGPAVVLVPK